jgi:hypothetical protein
MLVISFQLHCKELLSAIFLLLIHPALHVSASQLVYIKANLLTRKPVCQLRTADDPRLVLHKEDMGSVAWHPGPEAVE